MPGDVGGGEVRQLEQRQRAERHGDAVARCRVRRSARQSPWTCDGRWRAAAPGRRRCQSPPAVPAPATSSAWRGIARGSNVSTEVGRRRLRHRFFTSQHARPCSRSSSRRDSRSAPHSNPRRRETVRRRRRHVSELPHQVVVRGIEAGEDRGGAVGGHLNLQSLSNDSEPVLTAGAVRGVSYGSSRGDATSKCAYSVRRPGGHISRRPFV